MPTATMGKWGNTAALRIPQVLCEHLGISIGQKVRITAEPGRLIIEPETEQWTLKGRMKEWDGKRFQTHEYDWGEAQGGEVW